MLSEYRPNYFLAFLPPFVLLDLVLLDLVFEPEPEPVSQSELSLSRWFADSAKSLEVVQKQLRILSNLWILGSIMLHDYAHTGVNDNA